jgi:hypothetical protein
MITLSWWETFIVTAAISLLTALKTKLSNPVEVAALTATIAFLEQLLGGKVASGPQSGTSTTAILD